MVLCGKGNAPNHSVLPPDRSRTGSKNRIEENTVDSLEDALRVAPDHPTADSKLARIIFDSRSGDRGTNLRRAKHHATRAPYSVERDDLLEEIARAEDRLALAARVDQLAKDASTAMKLGRREAATTLNRSVILGETPDRGIR